MRSDANVRQRHERDVRSSVSVGECVVFARRNLMLKIECGDTMISIMFVDTIVHCGLAAVVAAALPCFDDAGPFARLPRTHRAAARRVHINIFTIYPYDLRETTVFLFCDASRRSYHSCIICVIIMLEYYYLLFSMQVRHRLCSPCPVDRPALYLPSLRSSPPSHTVSYASRFP